MLDKSKRYLIVGLGLLGGKYALELSRAGFHVDGINRSEGHLQYALDHGYIASGKTHDFEDLVRQADHIIFGLYPTALIEWFRTYGHLLEGGLYLYRCVGRKDRSGGAHSGHVQAGRGVHCQPPHGGP